MTPFFLQCSFVCLPWTTRLELLSVPSLETLCEHLEFLTSGAILAFVSFLISFAVTTPSYFSFPKGLCFSVQAAKMNLT